MVFIEGRRGLIDCVDHHELSARNARRVDHDAKGENKYVTAETLPMEVLGQRQLGEEDRRDLAGSTTGEPCRCLSPGDQMRHDREIADDDTRIIKNDVGPSAMSRCLARVITKPRIEFGVS